MTEATKAPGMSSSCWCDVDAGESDFFVDYLDRAAAGLQEARRQDSALLDVRPGSSVLDVGSGVGEFLIHLALAVPGVRAVGVDPSMALTAAARERAEAAGAQVAFVIGNAEQLEFADGSFDRVNCSRVLLHLHHPRTAITEMARVLAPGGRVMIWEPDFDAIMIDSEDLAIARAVRNALTSGLRHPDMGRRLARLLVDAGLELADVTVRAGPVASGLQHVQQQFHVFDHLDTAVREGSVTAARAAAWREQIQAADAQGHAVVTPVAFRVTAAKPA
jgi:SAM-dependent methyltransferase